ncbi:hypothetical protein [Clostridium estertheticum]|uniref:hypothetical protein n=1 Tax=Clostridium estertheticum TaxID=238834 RepID=UPI001CF31777|nr:hypothetical protein [Clostridium estertheticum]MCB2354240.1 hypothetical protein [Clostridium estertheticum]MCB2359774.1 hypothetical protein [Clostridium estertheticum]WAG42637.1 hypothetical protein LL065_08185 [Clostridium estertheticum]
MKSKQGTFIANCIRLKYKSTDNIVNPLIKSYGQWYDVYGDKGFTEKYEVLYIAVKAEP